MIELTEFKRAVMNKLSELQKNSERKFSELRNKDNEQKKYLAKAIFSIKRFYRDFLQIFYRDFLYKKNQTEILELKNSINELKNTFISIVSKADYMEDRVSELKDRSIEIQLEEEIEL